MRIVKYYNSYQDRLENKVGNYIFDLNTLENVSKEIKSLSDKFQLKEIKDSYLVYVTPGSNISSVALKSISKVKKTLDYNKADIIIAPNEIKNRWFYGYLNFFELDSRAEEESDILINIRTSDFDECVDHSSAYTSLKDEFSHNGHYYKINKNRSLRYKINSAQEKFILNYDNYDKSKIVTSAKFFEIFNGQSQVDLTTIDKYLSSPDDSIKKIGLNLLVQVDLHQHGFEVLELCLNHSVFDYPLKGTSFGKFLYDYFEMDKSGYWGDRLQLYKNKFKFFNSDDQIRILQRVKEDILEDIQHILDRKLGMFETFDIDWDIKNELNFTYEGFTSKKLAEQ